MKKIILSGARTYHVTKNRAFYPPNSSTRSITFKNLSILATRLQPKSNHDHCMDTESKHFDEKRAGSRWRYRVYPGLVEIGCQVYTNTDIRKTLKLMKELRKLVKKKK